MPTTTASAGKTSNSASVTALNSLAGGIPRHYRTSPWSGAGASGGLGPLERGLVHDTNFADRYERQLPIFGGELVPGASLQRQPKSAGSFSQLAG